jgi:hypothetical protein
MAAAAETLQQTYETEPINRRTDDVLYNVYYLHDHIINKQRREFEPQAEADVLEQDITGVTEADIHGYGAPVEQDWDEGLGQYVSLGGGTVDNSVKGAKALDATDEAAVFELFRRVEEVAEEDLVLWEDTKAGMMAGGVKPFISPKPTHNEVDPDVALSFDYDDRDMFRLQKLSPDGKRKTMISFSVFEIPIQAWASFLSARYNKPVQPTALAVMQFCHGMPLEFESVDQILDEFIGGVAEYLPEDNKNQVLAQLEIFHEQQADLAKQAEFYGREKLDIQKELACCLNDWASPTIVNHVNNLRDRLSPAQKIELSKRFTDGRLKVDDYVARLVVKTKTVTTHNRAGLATGNHRTMLRVTSAIGLAAAVEMAQREQLIQRQVTNSDFMVGLADRQIADAGVGCGGGCSVRVEELFSPQAAEARQAGLKGTLYSSQEINKGSQCACANKAKARVLVDGKNAFCSTCKEFVVNGKRGSLQPKAQKPTLKVIMGGNERRSNSRRSLPAAA